MSILSKKNKTMLVMAPVLMALLPSLSMGADHVVDIPGIRFAGEELRKDAAEDMMVIKVKLGEPVQFKNTSTVNHMVNTFHPDLMWNLGIQKPGETVTMRPPKKPGKYEIQCGYHADMKMIVQVEK